MSPLLQAEKYSTHRKKTLTFATSVATWFSSVVFVQSSLLAQVPNVCHAFATRQGGVSKPPNDNLNLNLSDDEDIRKNRELFVEKLGLGRQPYEVKQVHGAQVIEAPYEPIEEADGLWTTQINIPIAIRTADCAPILLVGLNTKNEAEMLVALHAGWRGACAQIAKYGIDKLLEHNFKHENIRAAIGPCIGIEHFEVGPEVLQAAQDSLDAIKEHANINTKTEAPHKMGPRGRPHLDLSGLIKLQLQLLGLKDEHIDKLDYCTYEDRDLFFSYRRDDGKTGRHLSLISMT